MLLGVRERLGQVPNRIGRGSALNLRSPGHLNSHLPFGDPNMERQHHCRIGSERLTGYRARLPFQNDCSHSDVSAETNRHESGARTHILFDPCVVRAGGEQISTALKRLIGGERESLESSRTLHPSCVFLNVIASVANASRTAHQSTPHTHDGVAQFGRQAQNSGPRRYHTRTAADH